MAKEQKGKFTANELYTKKRIKEIRLAKGIPMLLASHKMGITRKQLEDLEATRDYGSHVTLDNLLQAQKLLKVPVSDLVPATDLGSVKPWVAAKINCQAT